MGAVGCLRLREKLSVKVVAFFPTNQERRVPERGAAERSIDQGLQEKNERLPSGFVKRL